MQDETITPGKPEINRSPLDLPWILGGIGLTFFCFFFTMAPGLTWGNYGGDGGELSLAAYFWGVAHPSGYPFYTILGHLFCLLPFGGIAYKTNLLSVCSGALAGGASVWITRLVRKKLSLPLSDWAAFFFGTMIVLGKTLWSQCVITEVYALHVALNLWTIAFLLKWHQTTREKNARSGFLILAGWAWSCSLGVHLTSIFLFPAFALFILWTDPPTVRKPAFWFGFTFCCLLTTTLYNTLLWRAGMNPPINWGYLQNSSDLLDHITGTQYRDNMFSMTFPESIERLVTSTIPFFLVQWGAGTALFLLMGAGYGLKLYFSADGSRRTTVRRGAAYWIALWLPVSVYCMNYRIYDIEVYFALPYTLLGFLLPIGMAALLKVKDFIGLPRQSEGYFSALCILVLFSGVFGNVYLAGLPYDTAAENFGREAFQNLPPDSILISDFDAHSNALLYSRFILFPERRDVAVFVRSILGAPWYRQQTRNLYPRVRVPEPDPTMTQFPDTPPSIFLARQLVVANADKPMFMVKDSPEITQGYFPVMENHLLRLASNGRDLELPGSMGIFFPISMVENANQDYRDQIFQSASNPPGFLSFFSLGKGVIRSSEKIPFWILPPKCYSIQNSVFVANQESRSFGLMASPTAALHLACIGLKSPPGDEPMAVLTIEYQNQTSSSISLKKVQNIFQTDFNTLDFVPVRLDEARIPVQLKISSPNPGQLAIFAITQELQNTPTVGKVSNP